MTAVVRPRPPEPRLFAPFGTFVTAPADFGERAVFSEHLGGGGAGAEPVLHVNRVRARSLPHQIDELERHPRADQVFLPLNVSRYLVVVAPSDDAGAPRPDAALAFVVPGTVGVVYRAGVWHASAAVLDRPGNFAVLMWRCGDDGDDEFRSVRPIRIEDKERRPSLARA